MHMMTVFLSEQFNKYWRWNAVENHFHVSAWMLFGATAPQHMHEDVPALREHKPATGVNKIFQHYHDANWGMSCYCKLFRSEEDPTLTMSVWIPSDWEARIKGGDI